MLSYSMRMLRDNVYFSVVSEQQLGFCEDINSIKNEVVCGHRTVDSI